VSYDGKTPKNPRKEKDLVWKRKKKKPKLDMRKLERELGRNGGTRDTH